MWYNNIIFKLLIKSRPSITYGWGVWSYTRRAPTWWCCNPSFPFHPFEVRVEAPGPMMRKMHETPPTCISAALVHTFPFHSTHLFSSRELAWPILWPMALAVFQPPPNLRRWALPNTLPSPHIPYGIQVESIWNENIPWNSHGIQVEYVDSIWNGHWNPHGIHMDSMLIPWNDFIWIPCSFHGMIPDGFHLEWGLKKEI